MCCSLSHKINNMPWFALRRLGSSSRRTVGKHYATRVRQNALTLRRPGRQRILLHYPDGACDTASAAILSSNTTRQAAMRVLWKLHGGFFDEGLSHETGPRPQDDHSADLLTVNPVRQVGRMRPPHGGVTLGLPPLTLENARLPTALSSLRARNISAIGPETADSRCNV